MEQIAGQIGLSRTTVHGLVAALQQRDLVVRLPNPPVAPARPGRPPSRFAVNPSAAAVVGIDFSRGSVRVAVADLELHVHGERQRSLQESAPGEEAIDLAVELFGDVMAEVPIARSQLLGVGIGLPGPIDRTGNFASPTIAPNWIGVHPKEEMRQRLGLPVVVDNGSNLGALGETMAGAAIGCEYVAYVAAAIGIGCGLIINGKIYRGSQGTAGELGHTVLDEDGPICYCGNRGCLETRVGANAILALLRESHGPRLREVSRNQVERLVQVIEWAGAGDQGCRRVLTDVARDLGSAVANLCNLFNPERVVLGGVLGLAGELVTAPLRDSIARSTNRISQQAVSVVSGVLGDRAELVGALALAVREGDTNISSHLLP
jgi:predicted NBD/HSP70 family sugar kinase